MSIAGRPAIRVDRIVAGGAIILVGALLFVDRLEITDVGEIARRYWPLILVSIGLGKALHSRGTAGGWLLFIGIWMLMHQLGIMRIGDSWPLVIIAFGVGTIWKGLTAGSAKGRTHGE